MECGNAITWKSKGDGLLLNRKSFATGVWVVIISEQCQRWRICNIRGCKEKHSQLLHKDEENKTDGFAGTLLQCSKFSTKVAWKRSLVN